MMDVEQVRSLSMLKRVKDYYAADNVFRDKFNESPKLAIEYAKIDVDAEFLNYLDDINILSVEEKNDLKYAKALNKWYKDVHDKIDSFTDCEAYNDKKVYNHMLITKRRLVLENYIYKTQTAIRYFPILFELSKGCSMQCGFCAINAEKFEGNFAYTKENAKLFREIVAISKEMLGKIVGICALYYATEPLDNPDYEKFAFDFHEITGRFSQVTTVCADKYPERLREYIKLIGKDELYNAGLRFSVRNIGQFKKIMEEYSMEELAFIEVIANNIESTNAYAYSGKVRNNETIKKCKDKAIIDYTICCLNGFRVNMVDKKITFEMPSTPSDDIPDGYEVIDTEYFTDADDFRNKLNTMISRNIHEELPDFGYITLNPKVNITYENEKIVLTGDKSGCRLVITPDMKKWLEALKNKKIDIRNIKDMGIEDITYITLNSLYKKGYLKWYQK